MDYSFNGSMKEFIKGRIDAAMYSLEKKDPDYLGLLEKRSEIYDRIDRSQFLSKDENSLIKEYLDICSVIREKEEPAMYTQGFSDAFSAADFFND